MNSGNIVQIIGAVVDVDFSGAQMPALYNALTVDYEVNGKPSRLTLEVEQHLPGGWARTVAMRSTDGLRRGMVRPSPCRWDPGCWDVFSTCWASRWTRRAR